MRASSSSSGGGAAAAAAEEETTPFEDGQYVRLVNRGRGGYLSADDTGRGVSVDRRRGAAATAWAVQILRTPRAAHVLLRGAYGRYLAVTGDAPRPGHAGFHVAQCVFDDAGDRHVEWWTAPGSHGSVLLLHGTAGGLRALRANGRYKRWHTGVTVEAVNFSRVTSMMEWEVQVIPMTVERPPYQPRPASAAIRWHEGCQKEVKISFVRADDSGSFEHQGWREMLFEGRSLTELGNEIATRIGCGLTFENLTLFVLGGRLARPTPLLTDLPFRDDPVMIVVFVDGTPGHNALCFPDLAAE
ncbi:hypothetical protein PR202_ga13263 [Eleusine coracana subsp. coracana]|uniref:DUF569 domain-containing protein n=1 Tax=Eleusine coracana subsp. coracana TaxID=191504 RepID=A0AAV5CEG6_ELECO|nr:hypothetical protein QOZ80_3AG0218420 [Eleusine coracana subsp. coracana]GJM96429.1 hypothetical protein PR202_ga13263 [Eleusine coracana subsp. coracana]